MVALRIMLTKPITVATVETHFSKLKLIKTYSQSPMTLNRLYSPSKLATENDLVKKINIENVIKSFKYLKAREKEFYIKYECCSVSVSYFLL